MDSKVIITGTGRCGTTYLMKIFTLLGCDTGYSKDNMKYHIYIKCQSGLEKQDFNSKIIKNPKFSYKMPDLIKKLDIGLVIVPIRKIEDCTTSRVRLGKDNGGMPENINNYDEMLIENYKRLSILISDLVRLDIKYVLLDFEKMINNSNYLYKKLEPYLSIISPEYKINFEEFNFCCMKAIEV